MMDLFYRLMRLVKKILFPYSVRQYSMFAEDRIVEYFFFQLGKTKIKYLDIGASNPRYINNTFQFYERGSSGILIDANPKLAKKLKKLRPRDIVLNVGISDQDNITKKFYVYPDKVDGLGTFSEEEVERWKTTGLKGVGKVEPISTIEIPMRTLNSIIEQEFKGVAPNFVSLDVEGLDFEIIQSFDFAKYQVEVFCIETMNYHDNGESYKNTALIDYMKNKGYEIYADTRVNTIFAKKGLFEN